MATTKGNITVMMTFEKETKGAVRYSENKESDFAEAKIGTLYIRKSAFAGQKQLPETITVRVEF